MLMLMVMAATSEEIARQFFESRGWEVLHKGAPDFLLMRQGKRGTLRVAFCEVKTGHRAIVEYEQDVWRRALTSIGAEYMFAIIEPNETVTVYRPGEGEDNAQIVALRKSPGPRRSFTCAKCGYTWQARVQSPKACPKCFRRQLSDAREERAWEQLTKKKGGAPPSGGSA